MKALARAGGFLVLAGIFGGVLLHAGTPAHAQAPPTRVFAGKVAQVDSRGRVLVMDSPGSKKYPHPKIRWDAKTRWEGLAEKSHVAKAGQPIRVTVFQEKDGTFRAESINIPRPEPRPVSRGTAPVH